MSHYTKEDILQKIKRGENLEEENLAGLDLSDVDFGEISLKKADLRGANLQRSVFLETDLHEANLSGADLRGADLHMADLSQARLNGADLSKANLHMAKLVEADLRRANLQGANLHGSDLQHANLMGADFEDALLLGSNLGGAFLTVSDFKKLDLSQAINSLVKLVDHSALETGDSNYEDENEGDLRPIVDKTTEKIGLKFYVDQQKSREAARVGLELAKPDSVDLSKEKPQKKKWKIAALTVSVILGLVLGIYRLVLTDGSYRGFRLISRAGAGFIEGEIIRFKADSGDDGLDERLWVKMIDTFNQKSIFDHLVRNKKKPLIWEYEIDPHRIKSGDYRLLFGSARDKLLPIGNADRVLISVRPPRYGLTRILSARGNQSYSLHFIGTLSQTDKENIPYLLVKIGPYRMVTIRPEPVRINIKEVKYQLDVKLNGLKKADLPVSDGNFYEEYLCDRAGHKKLLYQVKSLADFFKDLEAVDYQEGAQFLSREFPTSILPDEKNKLARIDLFPTSGNPGFKLVADHRVKKSGELELTVSRPANLFGRPVYLYLDHRLLGVTCEATFKVPVRLGGRYYYGLIQEEERVVSKSNVLKINVTGNYKDQKRIFAVGDKNEINVYASKSGKSDAGGGDLRLTIYEYLEKCRKFAKDFPKSRRTSGLITGSFNDYDLSAIASNFDLLSQLINKPKYGLILTPKTFFYLLGQGDLNFEGVCLSYQDVHLLSKRTLNLKGINFTGADLGFIKLSGADLMRAGLNGANLNGADLRKTDLGRAFLKNCSLRMADLSKANLRKTDLRGADLRGVVLDEAVVDSHTIISLPPEYEIIHNTITKR